MVRKGLTLTFLGFTVVGKEIRAVCMCVWERTFRLVYVYSYPICVSQSHPPPTPYPICVYLSTSNSTPSLPVLPNTSPSVVE